MLAAIIYTSLGRFLLRFSLYYRPKTTHTLQIDSPRLKLSATLSRRRYSKKAMQYDGPAEFNLAAHRRPKLIIANEQFIVHRILGKDNLIGSWRCMYHHKGCKARASTFMVGTEVKYRSTCSSHNHKNVRCKLANLKMPWTPSE